MMQNLFEILWNKLAKVCIECHQICFFQSSRGFIKTFQKFHWSNPVNQSILQQVFYSRALNFWHSIEFYGKNSGSWLCPREVLKCTTLVLVSKSVKGYGSILRAQLFLDVSSFPSNSCQYIKSSNQKWLFCLKFVRKLRSSSKMFYIVLYQSIRLKELMFFLFSNLWKFSCLPIFDAFSHL